MLCTPDADAVFTPMASQGFEGLLSEAERG
jgi:hypothetical protein